MSEWRTGFGVSGAVAAATPVVALVLVAVAQITTESGDIREGAFPWLFALAALCFAVCCMGMLAAHTPEPGGWVLAGSWWVALAFLGIAGAFVVIGTGGALGIEEESVGVLAWLPVIGMGFGILTMTPALVVLGFGAQRKRILPRWGRAAIWVEAPLLPVLMIYGGIVEETAETIGSSAILGLMAIAWIIIGQSIRRAKPAPWMATGRTSTRSAEPIEGP